MKPAYRVKELPWGKSKTYELARQGRLELIKIDGVTLVDGASYQRLIEESRAAA